MKLATEITTHPQPKYIITEEQIDYIERNSVCIPELYDEIRSCPYISAQREQEVLDAVMAVVDQYIPFGDDPTAIMVREIKEAKEKAELRQQGEHK